MTGQEVLVRSISAAQVEDSFGNVWQYHSRSDRHSKVACWVILFDLLQCCSLLREHVAAGKVAFGINHEMRDFKQDRKKNLDLVLCAQTGTTGMCFADYGKQCGVVLDPSEQSALDFLPDLLRGDPSNVLLALEAKACMTEHSKALPRLHDELASSHQTIHGDTGGAIAAGFVMINCSASFVSTDRNRKKVRSRKFTVTEHKQPMAWEKTLAAVMKIPRRADESGPGFDALGVAMVQCKNEGSPVLLDPLANRAVSDIVTYEAFVRRLSHLYSTKFSGI